MRRRRNSDERGRRRERAARHDDTPAGQAAVLVERMRRGDLDPNRLLIGALLGDPVARLALPGWHRTGRSVSNLEDARSSGDLQYFLALPLNALDVIEYGDVHQVKIDPGGADWWPEAWQIATALFVDVMGDTARSVLRQRWRDEILSRSVRASDIHDLEFALRNAGAPPSTAQIRWQYYHALIDALYPWARGEDVRPNPPAWSRYPRTYVSPRSRSLTADEARVRDVTIGLKHGDPAAVEVAAHAMARFVPRCAVLVPAPSSTPGSYSGADVLARRLAELTGGEARALVGRLAPVESSRTRRRAGGKGLTAEEHAASMVLLEEPPAGRPLVLVDNVVVSGATLEGMKRVLGRPDLAVVAYSGAEEPPARRNPDDRLRDLERRVRAGGATAKEYTDVIGRTEPEIARWLSWLNRFPEPSTTAAYLDAVIRSAREPFEVPDMEDDVLVVQYPGTGRYAKQVYAFVGPDAAHESWGRFNGQPLVHVDVGDTSWPIPGHPMGVPFMVRRGTLGGGHHHGFAVPLEIARQWIALHGVRQNPPRGGARGDDRLRDLERARDAGDPQAGYAVHAERYRRGLPFVADVTDAAVWPAYITTEVYRLVDGWRAVVVAPAEQASAFMKRKGTVVEVQQITMLHPGYGAMTVWSSPAAPEEVQERLRFIYDQLLRTGTTGTFTPWS